MYHIVLLGPKHTGKTTVGRVLARLVGAEFADLDGVVEERTGKSPREFFREGPGGIAAFREAEAGALAGLLGSGERRVIAAGGGLTDNPAAAGLLRDAQDRGEALGVCLAVPARTAWERIAAEGELPPFLNTADPRETHRVLHHRRAAACQALARLVVPGEARAPGELAAAIAAAASR